MDKDKRADAHFRPKRLAAQTAGVCDVCFANPVKPERKACVECLDRANVNAKKRQALLKAEVIQVYGGKCSCSNCPETNTKFLTLDHINNDGNTHRDLGDGSHIWRWAKNNGFPASLRLMCANCNLGRSWNGGICPHGEHTSP